MGGGHKSLFVNDYAYVHWEGEGAGEGVAGGGGVAEGGGGGVAGGSGGGGSRWDMKGGMYLN